MKRLAVLTEIIAPYRIPVFNALAQQDDLDLHVIFLAETDPGMRQWKVYKDEIQFSFEVLPSRRVKFGEHAILLNRTVAAALSRWRPDVVLCGGYNYVASWQALSWAGHNKIPFFIWIESTASDRRSGARVLEFLKKQFVQRCCGAVVPGKSSFEYARTLGFPSDRIFLAPNAVDNELFARGALSVRQRGGENAERQLPSRFFLFVGRLIPEKGVFDLAEAYGKLTPATRERMGLVFVGDGAARKELIRLTSGVIPGNVLFTDFVQRDDLPEFYGAAEAFVFPTHSDPWGLVVNEAMASGLPIITTNVAGCAADLVRDGWNGYVVQARNSSDLARAMEQISINPSLREDMSRRSKELIREYSPEACAMGIGNIIRCVE